VQDDNIPIVAEFMPDKKLSKEEAEKIAQMGNSPTFVSMDHMRKLVPIWQDLSVQIFKNPLSNKVCQQRELLKLSCVRDSLED
jgi:hypothetical protein